MKHTRLTSASFAAVMAALACVAATVGGALPTWGADVPFTERVISTNANEACSVFATDVDGDGDTDVLSASYNDDKIAWYENLGGATPIFTERAISTAEDGAQSVFATDVDGDGDTDVLSASFNGDHVAWYENNGGSPPSFVKRVIDSFATGATAVFATDLDDDGDTDVLAVLYLRRELAWYENNGVSPPTFTKWVIHDLSPPAFSYDPSGLFAADLDGDDYPEVVSACMYYDSISWYKIRPSSSEHVVSCTVQLPRSLFVSDVDGDGDADILSASSDDDKIAWLENDGASTPSFTLWVISTAADGASSVFATDVDGDGDTDILSASTDDDKIAWYENNGGSPPSFSARVISTNADGAMSVFATDVDGDGDIDVLSASKEDNKIAWYENTTPIPAPVAPDLDPYGSHVEKNRYISMVIPIPAVAANQEKAVRVTLTSLHHPAAPESPPDFSAWEGSHRWVSSLNETHTCPDSPNFPGTTFRCAVLGCDPEYRAWGKELGGETLHVTGAAAVPSSDYEVAQLAASCAGNEATCAAVSEGLSITTCQFGDVDPLTDGLVVLDIARVVDHVKGKPYPTTWPPEPGTALFKPRVHLRPNVPDALGENVGVLDIATAVDAVKGNAYWHFGDFGPCTDTCSGEAPCP